MKLFNLEVFDGSVSGTSTYSYTPMDLNMVLGSAEKLFLQAYVTQVAGTTPTIKFVIQHSNDGDNWVDKINLGSTGVTANQVNVITGTDPGTIPGGAYVRLAILMVGNADNNANVRAFLTGRGEEA